MKTQSYKQKTHCTNYQSHRQSGFFLAVPVAGLALMLGVGGGIITSHKLGDVKETPVAESKMLPQSEFSALEVRPVRAQSDYFDTVYFDTEG